MAPTVRKTTELATTLPTTPTAEAWRAMTPDAQMAFQLQVIEALSETKAEQAQAQVEQAQAQAEQARTQAEQARTQAEQAQAQTAARALLTVLRVRGIDVPDGARARILAEKDALRLEGWLEKAIVAASLAEVLGEPG